MANEIVENPSPSPTERAADESALTGPKPDPFPETRVSPGGTAPCPKRREGVVSNPDF